MEDRCKKAVFDATFNRESRLYLSHCSEARMSLPSRNSEIQQFAELLRLSGYQAWNEEVIGLVQAARHPVYQLLEAPTTNPEVTDYLLLDRSINNSIRTKHRTNLALVSQYRTWAARGDLLRTVLHRSPRPLVLVRMSETALIDSNHDLPRYREKGRKRVKRPRRAFGLLLRAL